MAARNVRQRPSSGEETSRDEGAPPASRHNGAKPGANGSRSRDESAPHNGAQPGANGSQSRYRPLPTGMHGLDPEDVKRDQRGRLQSALVELIADRGYGAVRIVDLAKLAHVSQPTFYRLYRDKEDLFLSAYDEVAQRAGTAVLNAYVGEGPHGQRIVAGMRAWAELAAAEPDAISLLVLGAFGAGPRALERRNRTLARLEQLIHAGRSALAGAGAGAEPDAGDLTVKAILGGIREVTAARLREGRVSELPALADELTSWAECYPQQLPTALRAPVAEHRGASGECDVLLSERARRAEGRLPSGRSALPRQFIVKSQRERIVDATAAIVAERGLAALTVPEIARRANVSHQTFYSIYASKHEAFLGAQKVGMHQALVVAVDAYQAERDDWPRAARAGLRALVDFLASEPAHAHLSLVDTFAACPEALDIRSSLLQAFASYFGPAYELARERASVPAIAAEAIAGGVWQVMHHYVQRDCVALLPGAVPQLTYFALAPFLGAQRALSYALPDSA